MNNYLNLEISSNLKLNDKLELQPIKNVVLNYNDKYYIPFTIEEF